MEVNLTLAKDGFIDSVIPLKTYNDTLGDTFGKATDVNTALTNIINNKQNYLNAMVELAAVQDIYTTEFHTRSEPSSNSVYFS